MASDKKDDEEGIRRNYDEGFVYVNSIGGEVEIENVEHPSSVPMRAKHGKEDIFGASDDDIYGDLESVVFSSSSPAKTVPRPILEARLSSALKEISELKERVTDLSRENLILHNNFSSLLKTARDDKRKNIFTLRELRNQLRQVTALNAQHSSLSKEEVERIFKYCNQVENQLQSQISLQLIRQALEMSKKGQRSEGDTKKWTKQLRFDNMSIYLSKEQVPFTRLEPVTYLTKSVDITATPQSEKDEKDVGNVAVGSSLSATTKIGRKKPPQFQSIENQPNVDNPVRSDKRKHDVVSEFPTSSDDPRCRKRIANDADMPHRASSDPRGKAEIVPDSKTERKESWTERVDGGKRRVANWTENVTRREHRERPSRAKESPIRKGEDRSNYHRSRRKNSESRDRSRSRSPHLRSRTRASRRSLH